MFKRRKRNFLYKETKQDLEIATAYNEAYKALNENDPYFAAKRFLEAELLFPQSKWAAKICTDGSIFILYAKLL